MSERDIVELIRAWRGTWLPMDLGRRAAAEIERLRSAPVETEALREALEDAEYALERIELMTRDCYALPAWWRKVPQRVNEIALVALRRLSRPSTHVGDEG